MASGKKDYFGLDPLVSLILAIIPITAWVCGIITRAQEGKYVAAIISIFLGGWILWVCYLICMILNKSILRLLDL